MGVPCFISIISLPAAVLNTQLLRTKSWLVLSTPMILALIGYYAWHWIMGNNPAAQYTQAEMWQNITDPTIIMRLSLITLFTICIIATLISLWQMVPIYSKYIEENLSDSAYNVEWIKVSIIMVAVIAICYFAMLIACSPYVTLAYIISITIFFTYLIDISLFHRPLEGIAPLDVRWRRGLGWHVNTEAIETKASGRELKTIGAKIDAWMSESKQYTMIDFTTENILNEFTELSQQELTEFFRSRGETFQSYVRGYRIRLACEIIKTNGNNISAKQLFSDVGFSHYSSFSRSFVTVMGQSPSQYISSLRS